MIHNIVVGRLRDGVLLEAEHNRIRRELFDPFCEQIARVQFAVSPIVARMFVNPRI